MSLKENKQRFQALVEQEIVSTGKSKTEVVQEIAKFVDVGPTNIWLWLNPKKGWTSSAKAQRAWQYFEQAKEADQAVPSSAANKEIDYETADRIAQTVKELLLERPGEHTDRDTLNSVKRHLVQQIDLLYRLTRKKKAG